MGLKSGFKFILRRAFEITLISLAIVYIPNLPPNASISESYRLPPFKPLTGKLAINNKLDDAEIWHKGDLHGPECIVDYNGELYTGLIGGDIVKLVGNDHIVPVIKFGKPCSERYEEKLCGRPLGFQINKNGYLYAADAYYGIWKADLKTGKKELLISPNKKIDGKVPKTFNSIAVASNGDIYFSHSSSQFDLLDGVFDTLSDPSGRLIRYDPKTKTKTVLIDKLAFANGVILSDDEDFVLVAETLKSRILRYYLKGPKKGTYDIFVDGLPGISDNLSRDGKGGFLAALPITTDEDHPFLSQTLAPFPFIRKLIARILGISETIFETIDRYYPNEFSKKMVFSIGHFGSIPDLLMHKRVTVVRISKHGEIIDSIHTMNKKISHVCDTHIFKDTLYLGSYRNDYIVKIPLSKIGWDDLKTDSKEKRETKPVEPVKRDIPVVQEKKQPPTQAPKIQTTTPPSPKKEPQAKKESVQPQKQTPPPPKETTPPKPSQQQTQPPKQAQKQAPPPKVQTSPPKQEKQAPNKQQPTTTPKPQVKQVTPQKVESKKEQQTTQKPQTTTQKESPKQAPPAAATQKVEKKPQNTESVSQKVDSKSQQAQATPQKAQATTQKPQATQQKPQATQQKPQTTQQKAQPQAAQANSQATQQKPRATAQNPKETPEKPKETNQKPKETPSKPQGTPQKESPKQAPPSKSQTTPQKESSRQAPPTKPQATPAKESPNQTPPANKAPPVAQPSKANK